MMKKLLCILVLTGLVAPVSAQIDEKPVDPEATAPTQELYRYLREEVWGKKVLSGCQAEWDYNTNDALLTSGVSSLGMRMSLRGNNLYFLGRDGKDCLLTC